MNKAKDKTKTLMYVLPRLESSLEGSQCCPVNPVVWNEHLGGESKRSKRCKCLCVGSGGFRGGRDSGLVSVISLTSQAASPSVLTASLFLSQ